MGETASRRSSRERVAQHRARMRAQGFRLVQIWVPDTRTEAFRAEARRQSLLAAESDRRDPDLDGWLEAAWVDLNEETPP